MTGPTEPSLYVEVRFSDNGPGIEPKILDYVFIPFFTTKEKGSGLGLAVCKNLVQANGGALGVTSQEHRGTTFTLEFPIKETTP